MWVRPAAALAVVTLTLGAVSAHADPSLTTLPLGFDVTEFRGPASRVAATVASTDAFRDARASLGGPLVVVWGKEGGAVLTLGPGGEVAVRRASRGVGDLSALETGRGAAAGSRIQSQGALTLQFVGASRDYPHDALGSPVHPNALVIAERKPALPSSEPKPVARDVSRIEAGPGFVFEDREPHLADLDRDGSPEVLVIRSSRERGSSLAVVTWRGGRWQIAAETPPDGEPFRWLNPIGALPGPGANQGLLALVRRPHLDGVVQVWRYAADRIELVTEKAGYSNHVFGSPAQELAAVLPGDPAAPRIAVPTLDRRAIAILTFSGGGLVETARIPLPARVATGLAVLGRGESLHALIGLEDGRVADLRP